MRYTVEYTMWLPTREGVSTTRVFTIDAHSLYSAELYAQNLRWSAAVLEDTIVIKLKAP